MSICDVLALCHYQASHKGVYIKYVGGGEGGRRALQIFQKIFRSPGIIELNIS